MESNNDSISLNIYNSLFHQREQYYQGGGKHDILDSIYLTVFQSLSRVLLQVILYINK